MRYIIENYYNSSFEFEYYVVILIVYGLPMILER